MNNARRGQLKEANNLLKKTLDIVLTVLDGEQSGLDNIPESFQGTDRYEKMESAVENLEEAVERLEEARDSIDEAMV